MKFATIAILFTLTGTSAFADAATPPSTVPQYGRFEGAFRIPAQTGNPFDPADNDIDVSFTGPHTHAVVPAFWDGDGWKVRFAPIKTGKYTAVVTRNGSRCAAAWSTAQSFKCVKSTSAGYVRRDPVATQGFVFDSGHPFYPVGMNQAWGPDDEGEHYVDAFSKMHSAGARWARVWMTSWDDKNLEWTSSPKHKQPAIGDYSLDNARKLDTVVDAAEHSGVYIQLVLQHHGQYTAKVDPNWSSNPFNAANGGFLKEPQDFFTDARALALTRAKYRYVVARWGYSTHIMSFELFNEVQNISEAHANFQAVADWHKQMAAYLRGIDVDHHLVTTSISGPGSGLSDVGLDYLQIYDYVPDVITYFSSSNYSGVDHPEFVGEWGSNGQQTEQSTHDGLWASLQTEAAAPGMFWYWDKVDSENWWSIFHSASEYLSRFGVDSQRAKVRTDVTGDSDKRGALGFSLPGGWEPTKSFSVELSADGKITGLGGISSFVQGTSHRDMTAQPIAFHLHCAQAGKMNIRLGRVSGNGAHAVVTLDGAPAVDRDYPASGHDADGKDTLSFDLPAGDHVVTLFNTGVDWFTVDRISVDGYAPALAVLGRTDGKVLDFWAYNRDRDSRAPIDGTVTFHGVKPGRYRVRLWDTWVQTELPAEVATVDNGDLTVPIQGLTRDVAGTATPLP